jgi:CheY-like chemotaxis protein
MVNVVATILVIDDDPTIVHMLREDLEAEGYRTLEGFDGQTAIQLAKGARPQLIIMDVNMPGHSHTSSDWRNQRGEQLGAAGGEPGEPPSEAGRPQRAQCRCSSAP